MGRAIVIVSQGDAEFIGGAEYVEGRPVLDADGYLTLYDPLRLGIKTDAGSFATVMLPYSSFDWAPKTRFHRPGITEAGPIAVARYAKNVEEYKKEYDKQVQGKVKTPKLIVAGGQ